MNVEELKEYLKNNLSFTLCKHITCYDDVKLTFCLYLENEKIQEEYVYIKEGE